MPVKVTISVLGWSTMVKKMAVGRGHPGGGGLSHGTTGIIVNPTLSECI